MSNFENIIVCGKDKIGESTIQWHQQHTTVHSQAQFEKAVWNSNARTLWCSYRFDDFFTPFMTMAKHHQIPPVAKAPILLTEKVDENRQASVRWFFRQIVEINKKSYLPKEQIAEVLTSENAADLVIGGVADPKTQVLTLVRGDLSLPPLLVPFATFEKTADAAPDFADFEVIDHGQTIRLGKYEASVDAVLYELDADFRRRQKTELLAKERSFGASLKRLRIQRRLTQRDFRGITEKEIGRIERGEVKRPHRSTIAHIAKVLAVKPGEIETY